MIIGYASGLPVRYREADGTVRIDGTTVLMAGAKTAEEAVNMAEKNLKGFRQLNNPQEVDVCGR